MQESMAMEGAGAGASRERNLEDEVQPYKIHVCTTYSLSNLSWPDFKANKPKRYQANTYLSPKRNSSSHASPTNSSFPQSELGPSARQKTKSNL